MFYRNREHEVTGSKSSADPPSRKERWVNTHEANWMFYGETKLRVNTADTSLYCVPSSTYKVKNGCLTSTSASPTIFIVLFLSFLSCL